MAFDGRLLSGVGVLAAVVEAGSFVRAADILGLTPSGVAEPCHGLKAVWASGWLIGPRSRCV